jgi:hypothetical protein
MRIVPVQLTIKRAMIAVAAVAVIMYGARIMWLRKSYQMATKRHALSASLMRKAQRFALHIIEINEWEALANIELEDKAQSEAIKSFPALAEGEQVRHQRNDEIKKKLAKEMEGARGKYQKEIDYYDALRLKYERAADRPWLLVGPDPPPP